MKGLVYPLGETTKIYRELESSYLPTNMVKINIRDQGSCAFHSILMSISDEYQDAKNDSTRKSISNTFKEELKIYLLSQSSLTESSIIDRFLEAYEMSNMKNRYKLKIGSSLFDIKIVKLGENDYTSSKISYHLFPKNMNQQIKPRSKIFELLSLDFLTKIMDQRFLLGLYSEKVMEMEKVLSDDSNHRLEEEVEKLRELMAFNTHKFNNLSPDNLIKLIDDDFCENQDLLIKIFGETLKFNVFFCRSWNTEVSVIKEVRVSKSYPSIVIFKIDGKISITGVPSRIIYESGGILTKDGIKTILDPKVDQKIIETLREIRSSEVDGYHLEKYHTYLNSIGEKEVVDGEESESDEEIESEGNEEVVDGEESESDEEIELENKKDGVNTLMEESVDIPAFIRGYSDTDLRTLIKAFTSGGDGIKDRRNMEIMYSNYLRNQDENVLSHLDKVKADFV